MSNRAHGTRTKYTCARCGAQKDAKRAPFGWRLRSGRHICPACWPDEPAEESLVYRYRVLPGIRIPQSFWRQQRAARLLWDHLCGLSEETLVEVAALRRVYAPDESLDAEQARETARLAWERADELRRAWRSSPTPMPGDPPRRRAELDTRRDEAEQRYREAESEARQASRQIKRAADAAKKAARDAGCDESPCWDRHRKRIADAPKLTYREVERDGRTVVEIAPDQHGWRLQRGLADQVCAEYQTGWRAWISQRPAGRRMPTRHGQGLRGRARMSLIYSNGQSWARLARGTPNLTLRPIDQDRRGRAVAELSMAAGDEHVTGLVQLHRPLPDHPDAIRGVELVGEQVGRRWVWHLCVTIRQPLRRLEADPPARVAALDLRWRLDRDRIHVGYWLADDGTQETISVDLVERDGRSRRVRRPGAVPTPGSWRDYLDLQRRSDELLEAVKAEVWRLHAGAAPYTDPYRRMRSGGLRRATRRGDYPLAADLLADWQAAHDRTIVGLWRLRRKLIARRDQRYHEAAHRLWQTAGRVLIEGSGGQAMDLRPLASGDDMRGATQRHIVSPSRLREIVERVGRRYGGELAQVEYANTSRTCPVCGEVRGEGKALWLVCPRGHRYHQVWGACTEMLRRERDGDDGLPGGARESTAATA